MYQVIIVLHVLFGLAIIGLVLMQQGKGADAGAAFGAGASGTVFGAQGAASFLSRTTAIFATLFFTTSLGLAIYNSHSGVAYDLMSDKSTEQEALKIPEDDASKKEGSVQVPAVKTEDKPVSLAPAVEEKTPVAVNEGGDEEGKQAETPAPAQVESVEKTASPKAQAASSQAPGKTAIEASSKKEAAKK